MLGRKDIVRIVEGVREYEALLEKSAFVLDGLEESRERWERLLSERDALRAESERMHRDIAQYKEDCQNLHVRRSQWLNAVAALNTRLQFLVDEIGVIVGRPDGTGALRVRRSR